MPKALMPKALMPQKALPPVATTAFHWCYTPGIISWIKAR